MRVLFVVGLLAAAVAAKPYYDLDSAAQEPQPAEEVAPPMPYAFEYSASDPEGSHSHSSSSDGKTVTGQYSIMLADGRMRTVKYIADENGYRAEIITNELGTESKNPADVTIQSSAPTGAEAALLGPSSPGSAPAAAPTGAALKAAPDASTLTDAPPADAAAKPTEQAGEASYLNNVFSPPKYSSYRAHRGARF